MITPEGVAHRVKVAERMVDSHFNYSFDETTDKQMMDFKRDLAWAKKMLFQENYEYANSVASLITAYMEEIEYTSFSSVAYLYMEVYRRLIKLDPKKSANVIDEGHETLRLVDKLARKSQYATMSAELRILLDRINTQE